MENENMEVIEETVAPTSEETTETVVTTETETQDPLKAELERVRNKGEGKTELEKAIYKKNQIDARIKELKGETNEIETVEDDDDKPLTRGDWKKLQKETATKTALTLADEIESETERELTKYHLENSIKSTGNPTEDLDLARAIVNQKKNSQIVEMHIQKPTAKPHVSGGAPAKGADKEPELTQDEITLMKWSGISKEKVLESRPKA
jgi:acyl transferase domain-containing protein